MEQLFVTTSKPSESIAGGENDFDSIVVEGFFLHPYGYCGLNC